MSYANTFEPGIPPPTPPSSYAPLDGDDSATLASVRAQRANKGRRGVVPAAAPVVPDTRNKRRKERHAKTSVDEGAAAHAGSSSMSTMQVPMPPPVTPSHGKSLSTRPAFRAHAYAHDATPPPTYSEFYVGTAPNSPVVIAQSQSQPHSVTVQSGLEPWTGAAGGARERRRSRSNVSRQSASEGPTHAQVHRQFQVQASSPDPSSQTPARGIRPPKDAVEDAPAPQEEGEESQLPMRRITVFVDDLRTGRNYIAEVRTRMLRPSSGGGFWAEADDIVWALQSSPSRIDGPAKVLVRRHHDAKGFVEHIILRVPAITVPGAPLDTGKIPVHVESDRAHLTLQLYVEHDPAGMIHSCECGYMDKYLAGLTRTQAKGKSAAKQVEARVEPPKQKRRTTNQTPAEPGPSQPQGSSSRAPQNARKPKAISRTQSLRSNPPQIAERSPSLLPERLPAIHVVGNSSQESLSTRGSFNADDEDSGEAAHGRSSDEANQLDEPTPRRPAPPARKTSAPAPRAAPSAAFGASAFGGSAFSKYTQPTSGFGFTSAGGVLPTLGRPSAASGPPKEKSEEERRVDNAIIQYVRGELKRQPQWKVFTSYHERNMPIRQQLEMYSWAEVQISEWAEESTPEDLEGAPDARITRSHVVQSMPFFPTRHEDILDELLELHRCYGPGGTRGEDKEAVAMVDLEPAITPTLQVEAYLRTLKVADMKWNATSTRE